MSKSIKFKINEVIFGIQTKWGKRFDITLLVLIILSVVAVTLESIADINDKFYFELHVLEWFLTIIFTIEYLLRIYCIENPKKYIFSFYGIIDFLAIVPTYLAIFFTGGKYFAVIRAIRLLRVFRILKLGRFLSEAQVLSNALKASRHKITVFLGVVLTVVILVAALMYLIEGPENGFTSLPTSMYWAIVTLTTVGYGDIAPHTVVGKMVASVLMILGYGIIAVPTGIVSVEISKSEKELKSRKCKVCSKDGHDLNAIYCKFCAKEL